MVLLYRHNELLAALIVIITVLGLKLSGEREDVHIYVVGAIVGTAAEIIAVSFGVWQYANPTTLGIPLWLPFAWGAGAVLIKKLSELFQRG